MEDLLDEAEFGVCEDQVSSDMQEEATDADSSPVVRIVGEMITKAAREDASDIHFEGRR